MVCIPAQHVCLVLDQCGSVLLKKHCALGDDHARQVDGRPVQQHDVDVGCPQGLGQLMSKGGLHAPPVDRGIKHNSEIIVAHRACPTLGMRAKEIDQAHPGLAPKYG